MVTVCNAAHLKAAVAAAPQDSTIRFACDGTIRVRSDDDTVVVTGSDSGPRTLGIDGAGHQVTIDGGSAHQLVFISAGNSLRLANLTLAHGASSDIGGGGAIDNLGNLSVDSVKFEHNLASDAGGAIRNYGHGSATVNNSTFVGNQSFCALLLGGGGAIEQNSTGPLTISNSAFQGNAAIGVGVGGAIYAHADNFGPRGNGIPRGLLMGPVTISASRFTNNTASGNLVFDDFFLQGGGAIWSAGVYVTIDDTRFVSNNANFSAGAIRFFGSIGNPTGLGLGPRSLTIRNSIFDSNVAHDFPAPPVTFYGRGGAIAAGSINPTDQDTNIDPVTISGSTFVKNVATDGSAIYTTEPLDLTGSKLAFNTATGTQPNGALVVRTTTATVGQTKVLHNSGGGCSTLGATIVDDGANVEKPGNSCHFRSQPPGG